ncbi:hypothetical protein [Streptomyces sp. NPDC020951]|uniref:hypothetical protein n=1 Tax=Streptomyces sp. NPDC020951 TaxID=3365104 RepID=UPI0037B6BCBC
MAALDRSVQAAKPRGEEIEEETAVRKHPARKPTKMATGKKTAARKAIKKALRLP